VNKDDFAILDAEVVGVWSAGELGQHLDRADSFIDDISTDIGM
jgi:hypothetical protein